MRRIWNRLRICLLVLIAIITAAVVSGIIYLSEVGLNQDARDRIGLELERYGVYISFQDLTYDFSNGLTARQVKLFTSKERDDLMAELPHLVIDIDRTKFIRGRLKINKVALRHADLSLPLDHSQKNGSKVNINDLSGEFYFPSKDSIETSGLTANWEGLDITVEGHVWRSNQSDDSPEDDGHKDQMEKDYLQLLETLSQWDWKKSDPPKITLNIEGPFDDMANLHTAFRVESSEVQYKGFPFHRILLKGDLAQNVVTLDRIRFDDDIGRLQGKADYLLSSKDGRFEITSTIDFQRFSRTFLETPLLPSLRMAGTHKVSAAGNFQLASDSEKEHIHLSGKIVGKDFQYLGKRFDSLNTDFSYKDGSVYLDGLLVQLGKSQLTGKLMAQGDVIRYKVKSDLPVETYQPFLKGTPIMRTLSRCSFNQRTTVNLTLEGTMNRSNVTDWSAKGDLDVSEFSYNGVPLNRLKGSISLNALLSKYKNIEANFDYNNYSLKKNYSGPSSAMAKVEEIEFDKSAHNIRIKNVSGKFWPAPFVRLFRKSAADHIEDYKFTQPPSISASGIFTLSKSKSSTDFNVNVSAPETTYYRFLKKDVAITGLKAKVNISKHSVSLPSISFRAIDGPISGNLKVSLGNSSYSGFMKWTEIPLSSVNKTYQFSKEKGRGTLTGNIYFSGKSDQLSAFNAKSGTISLRRGTLFDVPVLGPLSPLLGQTIGKVIGNERMLNERAKDASCSFIIKNGVIYTNDFTSHTTSMNFTGHGAIDLNKETIDMTARMNIRGLLGVITLPLRPFTNTLFQFRGTGKLNNPSWNPAPFQAPPKDHPLFKKPPKATIVR